MSIKKIFDSVNKNTQYSDYKTEKEAYESVESVRNAEQLELAQKTFDPPLDYSKPENFAKFGSAYYYYKGALERISGFYPYDGSEAERNEFKNGLLHVEKYIYNHLYPRFTGYAILGTDWESAGDGADGWPMPVEAAKQYITFRGGPNTGSAGPTLVEQGPNPHSDSFDYSNIYDENIYKTAGLPDDYGKGTRLSNLRADFDTGVTVEFWMKTGSFNRDDGTKQCVLDWWNNNTSGSADYGRLQILTSASADDGSTFVRPFIVTVQSGAAVDRHDYYKMNLGTVDLHENAGEWNHYAIRLYNSGSTLNAKLYVNGKYNDSNFLTPYSLTSSMHLASSNLEHRYIYSSSASLQGWWRCDESSTPAGDLMDSSGYDRTATCAAGQIPTLSTMNPSEFITPRSRVFDGTNDEGYLGTPDTWNNIIGAGSGTKQLTLSAWVYKTGDGDDGFGRIISFGNDPDSDNGLIQLYTTAGAGQIVFRTRWSGTGAAVQSWLSSGGSGFSLNAWHHIAVTYDANSPSNDPIVYVDGEVVSWISTPTPSGEWTPLSGGKGGYIGSSAGGTSYPWEGNLAEVAVWNTVLGPDEVKALYRCSVHKNHFTKMGALNSKNAMGRIGGLLTYTTGFGPESGDNNLPVAGWGILSASLDEFRYWKVDRNPEQIGENYFGQVGGGANTDISNADLGVYFKFNEGITGIDSIDSIALDYAGRVSNGVWYNYDSTAPRVSRNTGSAIVSASAAPWEHRDPCVRTDHPDYKTLKTNLLDSGSFYDGSNNSAFVTYAPSWVIENHENIGNDNLNIIAHIMGSYFDTVHALTKYIPTFNHAGYTTSSAAPFPFAQHLPQSMGLYVPEIFLDATIMENLSDRSQTEFYESTLKETKDLIYENLYNNLANIYKAKGTEKAFRNVLRCFNIDDSLMRFKAYSSDNTYEIANNLREVVTLNKSIKLADPKNVSAVVYQRADPTDSNTSGFISGSYSVAGKVTKYEEPYGFTAEADVIFPKFFKGRDPVNRDWTQVSLFGLHTVNTASADSLSGQTTTWLGNLSPTPLEDKANFQVFAVRDQPHSKNAYFKLVSSASPRPFPELTSSVFFGVYDNEKWNFSVRLKPSNYPFSGFVSGSDPDASTPYTYDVIFRGTNSHLGIITDSFEISSSITFESGSNFLTAPKRMYAGAYRTNLTGAVLYKSDVNISNIKYWTKFLENGSLEQHVYDIDNSGISGSYRNISAFDKTTQPYDILNANTLALEWNFNELTSSDSGGNFFAQDFSSGSALVRNNYGWVGNIAGYQHTGYGQLFAASSKDIVNAERITSYKFIDPEEVVASNMIQVLSEDERLYDINQTVPSYLFTVEKSMYQAISEEMLIFFAGVIDFNNVIGSPTNRFATRYKTLEKLREIFFRRVSKTTDIEKFVHYYKWFDDAISSIFSQLIPASADFVPDVANTIESHVLERNKYATPFPTLEFKPADPDSPFYGFAEMVYQWTLGSTTLPTSPRRTDKHITFWKERALRDAPEITSGDATIDSQREIYRKVINSNPHLTGSHRSSVIVSTTDGTRYVPSKFAKRNFMQLKQLKIQVPTKNTYKGGVNFSPDKSIAYTRAALYPAGPINQENGVYIPENILLSFVDEFTKITDFKDPKPFPAEKTERVVKVYHGRDFEDGVGYTTVKSSKAFPFNIISSSLNSGYQQRVRDRLSLNIELTNLHNDVYGPDMEKPLQGPFSEDVVGGLQSRHVAVNRGSDTWDNRPEAWKILIGTCSRPSGAIGMAGADYPHPASDPSPNPYPMTRQPRAVYYRDLIAKSPVNIRNISTKDPTLDITVPGNYDKEYEIISTVGAYSTPRNFVEVQPNIPANVFQETAIYATSVRTLLDRYRGQNDHFSFVEDYSIGYLTASSNESVIRGRFAGGPGGIETMTPGYTDLRSDEYSVYNATPYKNLEVLRPFQGPSGTLPDILITETEPSLYPRIYDLHGKPYGLNAHLARHTARFGRDSLYITGTGPAIDGPETTAGGPGATYNQWPNWHKVHRNNLARLAPIYGTTQIESGPTLTNTKAMVITSPGAGNTAVIQPVGKRNERVFDATYAKNNSNHVRFSFAGWVKTSTNSQMNLAAFGFSGDSNSNQKPIHNIYRNTSGDIRYQFNTYDPIGDTYASGYFDTQADLLTGSAWKHVVITVSGTHGDLSALKPKVRFYVNGVSESSTYSGAAIEDYWPTSSRDVANFRGFGSGLSKYAGFFCKPDANNSLEFVGEADEFSLYNVVLTDEEAAQLYNSGRPVNLTASTSPQSASLLSWWRMGDYSDDSTAGNGSTAEANTDNGNNIVYDIVSGANLWLTAQAGTALRFGTQSVAETLPGQIPSTIPNPSQVIGYNNSNLYDNYYIKHQIPRSTKQYAWITGGLVSTNGWYGFVPRDGYIASGSTYIEAYNYVSASDNSSCIPNSNIREWRPAEYNKGENTAVVDVETLNLNIVEVLSMSSAHNTIGYPASVKFTEYLNYPEFINSISSPAQDNSSGYFLNSLLMKRNGHHGGTTWKRLRAADNPIVRYNNRHNFLSIFENARVSDGTYLSESFLTYQVPPISMRERNVRISARDGLGRDVVISAPHHDHYFHLAELDNRLQVNPNPHISPFQTVMTAIYASPAYEKINYVLYTENIFPSARNEFASHSMQRTGYQVEWSPVRATRTSLGATYTGFRGAAYALRNYSGSVRTSSFGQTFTSESSWVLDAPTEFLTRTGPYLAQNEFNTAATASWKTSSYFVGYLYRASGSAGALQSMIGSYFIGGNDYFGAGAQGDGYNPNFTVSQSSTNFHRGLQYTKTNLQLMLNQKIQGSGITPLYARPHMLDSPQSVVNSTYGIYNPLCSIVGLKNNFGAIGGPYWRAWDTGSSNVAAEVMYTGEARFEAGLHAGINKLVTSPTGSHWTFESHPSQPYPDDYEEYADTLKLLSKGYSIVPEFRLSRNLKDYIEAGTTLVPGKKDTFDIPGTTHTSFDPTFYVDYTNSEFLKYFKEIKDTTLLTGSQVRLVCSAAIKFHPYKGFYPAERTVDLVAQFKDSYKDQFYGTIFNPNVPNRYGSEQFVAGNELLTQYPGLLRPVAQPLFAPGILYNSIKSGLAVDYPALFDRNKMRTYAHYDQGAGVGGMTEYPESMIIPSKRNDWSIGINQTYIEGRFGGQTSTHTLQGPSGSFWDKRIPFEAIIEPDTLADMPFVDIEPHPSASLQASSSFVATTDRTYHLMARNFFGAVADFYLKDSEFTSLKSGVVRDDLRFKGSETFMARVKLRRSVTGSRAYAQESGSFIEGVYARGGGRCMVSLNPDVNDTFELQENEYFELPQDPTTAYGFFETFTMYSRPTAFGPAVAGSPSKHVYGPIGTANLFDNQAVVLSDCTTPYTSSYFISGSGQNVMDSYTGFNWSFTPPYYNGESWVDLIFRPTASGSYDLERIMAETEMVCTRVDPGRELSKWGAPNNTDSSGSIASTGFVAGGLEREFPVRANFSAFPHCIVYKPTSLAGYESSDIGPWSCLVYDPKTIIDENLATRGSKPTCIYGGSVINDNAMQATSSIDIFGVEPVYQRDTTRWSSEDTVRNVQVGKRWVIRPKWETPMMNFNDKYGTQPVTASLGTKTLPAWGGYTAANGMWHQFGTLPTRPDVGIFMEIEDISENWLKNHWKIRTTSSIYNNYNQDVSGAYYRQVRSLKDLCKFGDNSSRRLGELKDNLKVREAVVAVPYVLQSGDQGSNNDVLILRPDGKSLFKLPMETVQATREDLAGTPRGDSLAAAGQSVRRQIDLMKEFVFPPQFDFLTKPELPPIVMYIFPFTYQFDKDDLSYMWQNIMPRNASKITYQHSSVSHILANNELMGENDILQNPNLRWMVFKVKQRSQANYYDFKSNDTAVDQNEARALITPEQEYLQFNWPYDYFSFVEMIKMDAQVLYKSGEHVTTTAYGGQLGPNRTGANNGQNPPPPNQGGDQMAAPTERTGQAAPAAGYTIQQAPAMGGAPDGMGFGVVTPQAPSMGGAPDGMGFGVRGRNRGGGNY